MKNFLSELGFIFHRSLVDATICVSPYHLPMADWLQEINKIKKTEPEN